MTKPVLTPIALLSLLLLLLSACQELPYHTEYRDLPQQQWDGRDTLLFPLPTPEQDRDLNLTLAVRTTNRFAYREIDAQMQLLCDGKPLSTTSVPIIIHNDTTPQGTGLVTHEVHSHPIALHLQANHHYAVSIRHHMRLNPLDHTPSIGIIVE